MIGSAVGVNYNQVRTTAREEGIVDKVYNLGKRVLSYFVRNQHALAVAIWSYVIIEIGGSAAEITLETSHLLDIDSCRKAMCSVWTNYTIPFHSFQFPHIPARCQPEVAKTQIYSVEGCLRDLIEFLGHLQQEEISGNSTLATNDDLNGTIQHNNSDLYLFWEKWCPTPPNPKWFQPAKGFKLLDYITKCLENISTSSDIKKNEALQDLTTTSVLKEVHGVLKTLKELITSWQTQMTNVNFTVKLEPSGTNRSEISYINRPDFIVGLIAAIAAVVGGISGIVTAVVTCKASSVVTSAVLTEGTLSNAVGQIGRTAARTALALTSESVELAEQSQITGSGLEMVREANAQVTSLSGSYYSTRDHLLPRSLKVKAGSLQVLPEHVTEVFKRTYSTPVPLQIASSLMSAPRHVRHSRNSPQKHRTFRAIMKIFKEMIDLIKTSAPEKLGEILYGKTAPICLLKPQPDQLESYTWYDCLRDSLPLWEGASCLHDPIHRGLLCRLPLVRYKKLGTNKLPGPIGSRFLYHIFHETHELLCTEFSHQIWCDFDKFLTLGRITAELLIPNPNCTSNSTRMNFERALLGVYEQESDYQLEFVSNCSSRIEFV